MKQDLKSMNYTEIAQVLKDMGEPAFRAKQVFVWLHKGVKNFDEMTNLSKSLRQKLDENFYITVPQIVRKQQSAKDGTIKYLWQLRDGNCVETVLMRYGLEGRKELTQKEVAQKMGISQSYISRLEKRIMQRLKKEILRQTNCA